MRGPGWRRSDLREAAMNAFGAAAPLPGSSAAAGARQGGGESLEKIDMSLGEEQGWGGRCGRQCGRLGLNQAPGTGRGGTNQRGCAGHRRGRNQRGRGGWGGERTGPSHSESAGGARLGAGHGGEPGPVPGSSGTRDPWRGRPGASLCRLVV